MKINYVALTLVVLFLTDVCIQGQTLDTELSALTEKLSARIKTTAKKKVAVLDFTDLHGNASEFGKYVAEQLTLDFVMGERDFAVLDRANLKSILAEHKLTATGLVNPDNAKKLGLFAGVDALILGTMVNMNDDVELTAKVITTETAEIIGAAKCKIKADAFVKGLLARTVALEKPVVTQDEKPTAEPPIKQQPKVVKTIDDLRIEFEPLRIAEGRKYLVTMNLSNTGRGRSVWTALRIEQNGTLKGTITDADGYDFISGGNLVSGVTAAYLSYYDNNELHQATEIKPGQSGTATIKFVSSNSSHIATAGTCRIQLEFLIANLFRGGTGAAKSYSVMAELKVE